MIKRAKYVSKIVLIAVLVLCSVVGAWLIVPFSQKAVAESTNVSPSAFLYQDGYTTIQITDSSYFNVSSSGSGTAPVYTVTSVVSGADLEKKTIQFGSGSIVINDGVFSGVKANFQIDASNAKSVTIGASAFENSNLRVFVGNVELFSDAEPLTTIGEAAFSGCQNLEFVILPNSIGTIGKSAFKNTKNMTDIILDERLEVIQEEAFQNSGIVHLTLPAALKDIACNRTSNNIGSDILYDYGTKDMSSSDRCYHRRIVGCEVFTGCFNLVEVINRSKIETAILDVVFQNALITTDETQIYDETKKFVFSHFTDLDSDLRVLNIVATDKDKATYKGFSRINEKDEAEWRENVFYEGKYLYGHSLESSIFRTAEGLVFCENTVRDIDNSENGYQLVGSTYRYKKGEWYLGGYCGEGGKVELPNELTSATAQWSFNNVKYDYLILDGGIITANLYSGRNEAGAANAVTSSYDIGRDAFAMNSNIEYLTISGAVSVVGDNAFDGQPLKSIVMGDHLRGVGANAFATSNSTDRLWAYINARGTNWSDAFGTKSDIQFVYPSKSAYESDASNTTLDGSKATYLLPVTYVVNGRSAYSEEKLALGYTWIPDSENENCWKEDTTITLPNLADEKFGSGAQNSLYATTKWYTGDDYTKWGGTGLSPVSAGNVISVGSSEVTLYARSVGTPSFHVSSGTSPLIYNTGSYQVANFLDASDTYEITREFFNVTDWNSSAEIDWTKATVVQGIVDAGKYRLLVGLPEIYGTWNLTGAADPTQGSVGTDANAGKFVSNTITIQRATNSWTTVPSLNGWAYKAFDVAQNTVALEAQNKQNNGTAESPVWGYPDCTVSFSNGSQTYRFNLKRVGATNSYQFVNGTDTLGDVLKNLSAGEYDMTVTYPAIKNYSEISNTVHFQVTPAENDWAVRPTVAGWEYGALKADSVLATASVQNESAAGTLQVTLGGTTYTLERTTETNGWKIGATAANKPLLDALQGWAASNNVYNLIFAYSSTTNYNATFAVNVGVTVRPVSVAWSWGEGQSAPQGVIGGTVTGSYSDLSNGAELAKIIPEFAVPDLTAKGIEYEITYRYSPLGVTTRAAGTAYSTHESFIRALKEDAGAGTYTVTVTATPRAITGTGAVQGAEPNNYQTLINTYTLVINKATDGWMVNNASADRLPSYQNWKYKDDNVIAAIAAKSGATITFTVGMQTFTGTENGKDALTRLNEYLKNGCDVGTYIISVSTVGGNNWEDMGGQAKDRFTVVISQADNEFKTEDSSGNPLNSKLTATQNGKESSAEGSATSGSTPDLSWVWDDRNGHIVDLQLNAFETKFGPVNYRLIRADDSSSVYTSAEINNLLNALKLLDAGEYQLQIGTEETNNWMEAYRYITIEISAAENNFSVGSLTVKDQSTLNWTWDNGAVEFDFTPFATDFGTLVYLLDGNSVAADRLRMELKALDAGSHILEVSTPAVAGKYVGAKTTINFTVSPASNSFTRGRVEYLTQDNDPVRVSYRQANGTKEERTLSWTWGDTLRSFAVTLFESDYGSVFYELDGTLIEGSVQNALLQLNAREHTLRIYTETGNINYASAEMEIYFNVAKGTNDWLSTAQPMLNGWTYGETASELRGTPIYGVDDMTVQWQRRVGNSNVYENIPAKPVNAGTYRAILTVPASPEGNYDALVETLDFVIAKARPVIYNQGVNTWAWDHFDMYTSIRQASSTHNAQIHYAIVSAPGSANQVDLRFGYSDLTSEAKGADGLTMAQRISALLAGDYILTMTTTVQDNYEEAVQTVEFTITTAQNSWELTPNIVSWVQFAFVPAENLPKAIALYGDVSMTVTNLDRTRIYYTGTIIPERDTLGKLVTDENGEYRYTLNDAGGQYGDLVNMPAGDYTLYISVASSAGQYETLTSTTTFRIFSGSQQRPQNYWTTLPGMDMWISEMEDPAIPVGETLYWSQMKYEYFGAQPDESGNRYEPIDSEPLATQFRRIRRPSEDGEEVVQDPPTLVEGSNPVPQKPGWYIVRITAVLEGVGGVPVETLTHDVAFQIREAVNTWTDAPYVESWYINDGPSTPYAGKTSYESQVTFRYKTVEEEGVEPTYFDTMPTKPGKYIMIATARATVVAEDGTVGYAKYCEPLVTEIPFSISLSINTWLQLPIIDSWSEEFGPNDPQGQVAHGNIVYTYFLKDGDNLIELEEKPLSAGNYLLRATVEEYGYETLVSEVEFTISPAWDETFLTIDIVLGVVACAAAVAVIILAYRRKSQC